MTVKDKIDILLKRQEEGWDMQSLLEEFFEEAYEAGSYQGSYNARFDI